MFLNPVFAQVEEPVKWSLSTEKLDENHVNLIINAQIEDHWHLYGQYFGFGGPMPLYFEFNPDEKFELIDSVVETPNPIVEFDDVFEVEVNFFEHEATFTQKVKILSDEGFNITGIIDGQACFEDVFLLAMIWFLKSTEEQQFLPMIKRVLKEKLQLLLPKTNFKVPMRTRVHYSHFFFSLFFLE
jgi:hypothetical protein